MQDVTGTIAGHPASKTSLLLQHQQFAALKGREQLQLPAGKYDPVGQNEEGVFYEAPLQVTFFGRTFGMEADGQTGRGGIFVYRNDPRHQKGYAQFEAGAGDGEIPRALAERLHFFELEPSEKIKFSYVPLTYRWDTRAAADEGPIFQ